MFNANKIKRLVVKVGTSTLTYTGGKLNFKRIDRLARALCDLRNAGTEVALVSSGAIAVGVSKLMLENKPADIPGKQAMAAVGQCELMHIYDKFFGEYGVSVAQVLLTRDVVEGNDRRQNVVNTMNRLLELGVIPIVNENDTVSTEEIEFGDNDTLSAHVAVLCGANLLIILSDIDGLYDCDPRGDENARLIPVVHEITPQLKCMAGGAGSSRGTGGMITKISAAEIAKASGIDTVVANGENPEIIYEICSGKVRGTLFKSQ